ncbi:hypothetical protein Nepgr_011184 [Nepenthes gracilis]|uniref:Uncharacterized protein n=1 Tax=Nepenthes gracilis TaxID=150966 RepID=A0AAD3XLQ6_NEPGR|nr:hypothetical protein Nepgr_011184 [Nepenthes gracilis]
MSLFTGEMVSQRRKPVCPLDFTVVEAECYMKASKRGIYGGFTEGETHSCTDLGSFQILTRKYFMTCRNLARHFADSTDLIFVPCHGRKVSDNLKREYKAQSEVGRRSEDLWRRKSNLSTNLSASSAAVDKLNDEFNHLLLKLQPADETITDRKFFVEKWSSF